MIKIFAKTMLEGRMIKYYKYTNDEDFEIDHFEGYIKDICEHFDSPSPIVLTKHIRDYIIFGTTTFTPDDFVEKVYFDKLIIETFKI